MSRQGIVNALQAIHDAGVKHNNLDEYNVLVATSSGSPYCPPSHKNSSSSSTSKSSSKSKSKPKSKPESNPNSPEAPPHVYIIDFEHCDSSHKCGRTMEIEMDGFRPASRDFGCDDLWTFVDEMRVWKPCVYTFCPSPSPILLWLSSLLQDTLIRA